MGNCTSARSVSSPAAGQEEESTRRIVTTTTTTSSSKPPHELLVEQKKKIIDTATGDSHSHTQMISANQLLPFDEVSHESSDTHRLTLNGGSFDYEDVKVVFYENVYRRKFYEAMEMLEKYGNAPISDYLDCYKRAALHWACIKGAPSYMLNILIEDYPHATAMKDYMGRTPLHLSCEYGSDQSILALLKATESAVVKYRDSKNLRTPLAEAIVNSRSPSIIRAILSVEASQITTKDLWGNTPVVLYFRKNLGQILASREERMYPKLTSNLDDLVEVLSVLLQQEENLKSGSHRDVSTNFLSNAIKCKSCPFAFVNFIISTNPELMGFMEHGESGDLPIHVVCRSQEQYMEDYKCDDCGKAEMATGTYYFHKENSTSLRQVLCDECTCDNEKDKYTIVPPSEKIRDTTKALLVENDEFAKTLSDEGMLPLVLALKYGQTWLRGGIQELIDAYPQSLSSKDKATDLFPFQLAAVKQNIHYGANKQKQGAEILTTIYELLKRWPLEDRISSN